MSTFGPEIPKVSLEDITEDESRDDETSQSADIEDIEVDAILSASVSDDVDRITENDIAVLRSQMSSDQLVSDRDVINTEILIENGKQEERELSGQLVYTSLWDVLTRGSINIILPFINGMMLGFGEILAHEIGFRYNWIGARVQPPRRMERKNNSAKSQFL
ncbi:uncharacterized protein PRCAT00002989001 [Priceomyces carsonii]|uniref:uncharacterized protein n=1 Tax=Priceomyces carsonii TaxID=28549 RepID=UPI002EDA0289|nr:unnamed protein product [Priceomyces carsonii]